VGKPFGSALEVKQLATPSGNPAAGAQLLYPKSDGMWYTKTPAGLESQVGGGGGGGGGTLLLVETSTPTTPAADQQLLHVKPDRRLYTRHENGVDYPLPPITVAPQASPPASPETGDLWVATDVNPAAQAKNFAVSVANPNLTGPGMWVQIGMGPVGNDWTIWIEDGQ